MEYRLHPERQVRNWLAGPFIWLMIVPVALLNICLELYHQICFRLYGIPLVNIHEYVRIDRQRMKYLKWQDKINCAYCSYANGVLAYAVRIAGDTEKYWCGIKSQEGRGYVNPPHRKDFAEYNNKADFEKKYCKLEKNSKKKK